MKLTSTLAPVAAVAMLATLSSAQATITQHGYTCLDASYTPTGQFSHYGCGVGVVDAQFGIPFTASWCDTAQGVKDLCNPNNQIIMQQQPQQQQQWVGVPPPIAVSRRTAAVPVPVETGVAGVGDKVIVPGAGATLDDMEQVLGQLIDAGILDSNLNFNAGTGRNLLQADTSPMTDVQLMLMVAQQLQAQGTLNTDFSLNRNNLPRTTFAAPKPTQSNLNVPVRRQSAVPAAAVPSTPTTTVTTADKVIVTAPGASVNDMDSALLELQNAGILDGNLNFRG